MNFLDFMFTLSHSIDATIDASGVIIFILTCSSLVFKMDLIKKML